MENKINVAGLLLNCPKGMPLDCSMWDNVTLKNVVIDDTFPIKVAYPTNDGDTYTTELTKYGCWSNVEAAKCVIFPKGKTTWEGFVPPNFKDGDILAEDEDDTIYIYNGVEDNCNHFVYAIVNSRGLFSVNSFSKKYSARYATEEEKEKLFNTIKSNGYRWNSETKTLVKLIEKPKFKVGDKIVKKNSACAPMLITTVSNEFYYSNTESSVGALAISEQDNYELVPNKFDINSLVPFESRVLVRSYTDCLWRPAIFGFYMEDKPIPYCALGGTYWKYCIPYEGNEHLRGKVDDCDSFYKNWE